ncbi:hypothetical protein O3G_MSEX010605 [Manduca sexta]|uniref:Carboxylesterase type B domain-containing protein n=1 Tax=Manduca sexta TaxID=7130 RepID=A0A921ZI68_MANSE|nr:hypothetical protein O3G_MSEX010605 [Manduca sexta]
MVATFFIENDVILVTLTHRIGPFGFLKVNESDTDTNMGLKDIVMALTWIKRNVKVFSGDNKKITVMGSGSAATLLSLLLTTKSNKLFAKMILQSGSIYSPSLFLGDNELEKSRLRKLLAGKGNKVFVHASTSSIVAAAQKIYNNQEIIQRQRPLIPFLPIRESNTSLLTKSQKVQSLHTKPMLIGFNSQESISDIIPFLQNPQLLQTLAISFKFIVPFASGCQFHSTSQRYKNVAETIKKKYFKNGVSVERFLSYATDLYKYPVYKFMKEAVTVNDKVYAYKFNYNGNFNAVKTTSLAGVNVKVKGAANGDELCYLLKCEPLWENYVKIYRDVSNRDRIFIQQITELWSNFAKFSDPTPIDYRGNITWPPMSAAKNSLFHIGRQFKMVNDKSENAMFAFWNEIYEKYYSPEHCENKHDEF